MKAPLPMVIVNLILVSLNLILLAAPACAGNNRSTPQRSVKHTSLAMPGKGWQKAFTTFTNYPATVILKTAVKLPKML